MRVRSPMKRCQQKPTEQLPYSTEIERNPDTTPHYFQISVNVLEARKLVWMCPNLANSYVIVVLGKKKRRTSVRKNMTEPCYKEFITFELYSSIRDIQRSSIWLAVMEPRCCGAARLMGEATINLAAIWSQPHHQVFHKWAQLSLPRYPASGGVGFLKVDISIIFKGDIQVMPLVVNDVRMEENLLLPTGAEQQPANYIVTIYGIYNLSNSAYSLDCKKHNKTQTSFVRVSFCGLSAETAVQMRSNNPTFNEQISIVERFPNMNDVVKLEVCSGGDCLNRTLGSASLKLSQISHDGENGFLPTFGPSLLHMYCINTSGALGNCDDGPFHCGAILLSLRIVVPYYQRQLRTTNVEPALPLPPKNLWTMDNFCILCAILEISMVDKDVCGNQTGVALTVGDLCAEQDNDEFLEIISEIKTHKLYYTGLIEVENGQNGYVNFNNYTFPVLQLASRLPDYRYRMYRNNIVRGIVTNLEQSVKEIECRFINTDYNSLKEVIEDLDRAADDAAGNILKFLDILEYSSLSRGCLLKYVTELDEKQLALQKEEAQKIYQQMAKRAKCDASLSFTSPIQKNLKSFISSKKEVKMMIADLKNFADDLKNIIYTAPEGWPDVVIWLMNGGSRAAYVKIPMADIIHSVTLEQSGKNCGLIQTVYLKPLKCPKHLNDSGNCFCIAGKIELILWVGLHRQSHTFAKCLPNGYHLETNNGEMCIKTSPMLLECRAYIHRAKLNKIPDDTNVSPAFVRINALNSAMDTRVEASSGTYIWNELLKIRRMMLATPDRIMTSPLKVLVDVYEMNLMGKRNIVGRFEVEPVLENRQEYQYAPKLQWFDLFKGMEHTGRILMSVQLLQVPERILKIMTSSDDVTDIGKDIENEMNIAEVLPPHLIPQSTNYKLDVYWWGLRDVTNPKKPCVVLEIDDFTIKSNTVADKNTNSNFINGKSSETFQVPFSEIYSPPLNIRLYDICTFGRTLFLGINTVKNPSKYIVSWIPKAERESCLKSASICASQFIQEHQTLYVRKNFLHDEEVFNLKNALKRRTNKNRNLTTKLKQMFGYLNDNEEEYRLLPTHLKQANDIKLSNSLAGAAENKDWWTKYFASLENVAGENDLTTNTITIYSKELETQPEFHKFKDWCLTIKLYNGKKTGIPEKDEQLSCGILKVGIAIYKWPPPPDTVAVSRNGVDLTHGYFNDHPSNDPAKFLVRVYVVKGTNLAAKGFTGMLDPYVSISCGNKQLGDRKSYVKNTLSPTFGKMYEFRCTLPDDYLLTVSLYDYDTLPPDELIGSTTIDLEDRVYSKHRAMVGIAAEYNSIGYNKWRDSSKPSVILEDLCAKNHLPPPSFPDSSTVLVNEVEYRDYNSNGDQFCTASARKEQICLSLLRKWHTLPVCGYHLVPEHVETRTLFNPEKPGLEMGKLKMWVDIFPLSDCTYIPPAVNITPRKLEEYELRVIVRDVQGLQFLHEGRVVTAVCVRAWLDTIDQAQYTDIDYSASKQHCCFNWRMIFKFSYHLAEKKLVRQEKSSLTEEEEHFPPIFVLQVLNNSMDAQNESLGSLTFNLNSVPVPRGAILPHDCKISSYDPEMIINLFSVLSIRAWWPLIHTNPYTGYTSTAGMIDLELALLPKEKAAMIPAGYGRSPPASLAQPARGKSCNVEGNSKQFFKNIKTGRTIKVIMCMLTSIVLILIIFFVIIQTLYSTYSSGAFIY